jgi:gas vesicle protein
MKNKPSVQINTKPVLTVVDRASYKALKADFKHNLKEGLKKEKKINKLELEIKELKNPTTKTITYTEKDFKEMVNGWNEEIAKLKSDNKENLKLACEGANIITNQRLEIEKLRLKIKELEGK